MRDFYYDKNGQPITRQEWSRLFDDRDYQVIKQTRHKERGREFWLSTVWLGLDHNYHQSGPQSGPPIIFETMAKEYKPANWRSVIGTSEWAYQDRYPTEEEALRGHDPWQVSKELEEGW